MDNTVVGICVCCSAQGNTTVKITGLTNLPKTMLNFLLANLPKWWRNALHSAVWKHKGATVTKFTPADVFRNLTQLYQFLRRPVSVWIKCSCEQCETKFLNYHYDGKENHWKGSPETQVKIRVGHEWAVSVRCISTLPAVCLHERWNFRWIPNGRTVDCSSSECFISTTSEEFTGHFQETADIIHVAFLILSISTFKSGWFKHLQRTSDVFIWQSLRPVLTIKWSHRTHLFEPTEGPGSDDADIWILIHTGRTIPQYVSINCSAKHLGVLRYRRKGTLLDHIPYGVFTQMASHTHTHTHTHTPVFPPLLFHRPCKRVRKS